MKLTKNGVTMEIENPIHIDAFKTSGWAEEQDIPAPKPEKKVVVKPTRKKKD
jgi:hypothetical protein